MSNQKVVDNSIRTVIRTDYDLSKVEWVRTYSGGGFKGVAQIAHAQTYPAGKKSLIDASKEAYQRRLKLGAEMVKNPYCFSK